MSTAPATPSTKVITGRVRLAYPNVFKKRANLNGKEEFSLLVLVPKSDSTTVANIRAAIETAAHSKFGPNVKMSALKISFRDGDQEDKGEEYEGHYFMNLRSQDKPGVVDSDNNELFEDELKSGDWGRVSMNAYAYDHPQGGKGVSFGLHNVKKLEDGDPIGNRSRASDDFNDGWEASNEERW